MAGFWEGFVEDFGRILNVTIFLSNAIYNGEIEREPSLPETRRVLGTQKNENDENISSSSFCLLYFFIFHFFQTFFLSQNGIFIFLHFPKSEIKTLAGSTTVSGTTRRVEWDLEISSETIAKRFLHSEGCSDHYKNKIFSRTARTQRPHNGGQLPGGEHPDPAEPPPHPRGEEESHHSSSDVKKCCQ